MKQNFSSWVSTANKGTENYQEKQIQDFEPKKQMRQDTADTSISKKKIEHGYAIQLQDTLSIQQKLQNKFSNTKKVEDVIIII